MERRQAVAMEEAVEGGDTELIMDTMAEQPTAFIEFVGDIDTHASEALRTVRGSGMEVRLAHILPDEQGDDDRVLPSAEFGVFYYQPDGLAELRPRMYIARNMIQRQYNRFGPLFSDFTHRDSRMHHVGSTVAATSWMALGKWAIETLDPRLVEDHATSVPALRAISRFTNISVDELDVDQHDDRISEIMCLIAYRMAGGMAYAGLARYLKEVRNPGVAPRPDTIAVLQSVLQQCLIEQSSRDASQITPTDFALSYPLKRREVVEVFRTLGPVAAELRNQGRLRLGD
jgi:hypothetical protein